MFTKLKELLKEKLIDSEKNLKEYSKLGQNSYGCGAEWGSCDTLRTILHEIEILESDEKNK